MVSDASPEEERPLEAQQSILPPDLVISCGDSAVRMFEEEPPRCIYEPRGLVGTINALDGTILFQRGLRLY